jgi:carboxyl-terminal processing protease
MSNLILDLSNNGGGYLQASLFLADHFLSNDKLMLTVKGKTGLPDKIPSTSFGSFEKGRLVVMIDEGSASASEIVSGAVQDHDRGVIAGRRSFGKGMVQERIELKDSSVIRLTIKRFYTPSGRCIQKPYEKGIEKYYEEVYKRYETGELISKDSIQFPDSLKYKTSNQRDVYGGGGIMPDIFVPLDTNWSSDLYMNIARKGHQNTFCLKYVNENRTTLNTNYNNVTDFNNSFDIKTEVEDEFIKFIKKEKISFNPDEYKRSQKIITTQLKALIARNLWGTSAYFYIINNINPIYIKAIEIISTDQYSKIISP